MLSTPTCSLGLKLVAQVLLAYTLSDGVDPRIANSGELVLTALSADVRECNRCVDLTIEKRGYTDWVDWNLSV